MALTPDQVKQLVELLKQQAAQQQEINSGIEEFEHEGDVYIKFKPSDGYTSSKPKNQTQPTP